MKKILIITILASLLVSCGTKNDEKDNANNLENKPQIHTVLKPKTPEQKYGTIAKFIKTDLTPEEEKTLEQVLEERKQLVQEIKKDLQKAKKEGKFEEKMLEVEKQREEMANKILPFVKEDKKEAFKTSCKSGNELLRKKLG